MDNRDMILMGRAINGLGDARDILRVLVDKGVLPTSWREIESVLETIHSELSTVEAYLMSQTRPLSLGPS